MNEKTNEIVNRLVKYKFSIEDVEEVASLVNRADFRSHYYFVEDLQVVFKEQSKNDLRAELKQIIVKEKLRKEKSNVEFLHRYKIHAIAASILIFCVFAVAKSTTGYNDVKNFRKAYVEKHD